MSQGVYDAKNRNTKDILVWTVQTLIRGITLIPSHNSCTRLLQRREQHSGGTRNYINNSLNKFENIDQYITCFVSHFYLTGSNTHGILTEGLDGILELNGGGGC